MDIYHLTADVLKQSAEKLHINAEIIPSEHIEEGNNGRPSVRISMKSGVFYYHRQFFFRSNPDGSIGRPINGPTADLLIDKQRTKKILSDATLPTPQGAVFTASDLASALRFAADCQGELCIKPNRGTYGHLVFPWLRTADEITEALATVATAYDEILVEESVPGGIWRFFYVHPDIVGIQLNRPASVVGDGSHSISELISQWTIERKRRQIPWNYLELDQYKRDFMMLRQGMTLQSIPENGRRVYLNPCSNGMQGSDGLSYGDTLNPGYKERILHFFRMNPDLLVSAADVAIEDPACPPNSENFHVLEINSRPGFLPFHYPWEGPVQDICGAILLLLERLPFPRP